MNRSRRSVGFSLVEILVTMSIMLALASTAGMYYGAIVPEQKIGRAKTDIQQFKKAVAYFKGNYKGPLTSDVFRYEEDGPPWPDRLNAYRKDEGPDVDPSLDKLLKFSIIPRLTPDPWGMDYRIDVQNGWLYSPGPDGTAHVGSDLGDDVVDSYQPGFLPLRARAVGRMVEVEFTRELSRRVEGVDQAAAAPRVVTLYRLASGNFTVKAVSGEALSIETAVIDLSTPFIVNLRLAEGSARPSEIRVKRDGIPGNPLGQLRSADGALLSTAELALTTSTTSRSFYLP